MYARAVKLSDWHLWFKREGGRELRNVLLELWDPIGVADEPLARDEYDGYIGRIADRLRRGSSVDDVAAFLSSATLDMGLPPDQARDRRVAAALATWYQGSTESWAHQVEDGPPGDIPAG